MRTHAVLVICAVLVLSAVGVFRPPETTAGLVRISFDFIGGDSGGYGHIQFEDISLSTWYTVPSGLLSFEHRFYGGNTEESLYTSWSASWIGDWTANVLITEAGPGIYVANFVSTATPDNPWIYKSDTDDAGAAVGLFVYDDGEYRMTDQTITTPRKIFEPPVYNPEQSGSYTASVWFDDPQEVPIPAPAILLAAGLLSLVGLRKRLRP